MTIWITCWVRRGLSVGLSPASALTLISRPASPPVNGTTDGAHQLDWIGNR